ncbi:MAG: hypothetical protein PGN34_03325 [Methylobacterium frigidaeris]
MPEDDGFTITPTRFRKVRGSARFSAMAAKSGGIVEAIVRVSEPGYVPPSVRLRSRIDPLLMTAEMAPHNLSALDQDPKVESVSVARPLRPASAPKAS